MTIKTPYRCQIEHYIQQNALPADKFSHQPRLYQLACTLARMSGLVYDDDILHAAVWLHDLGVFIGHRPDDPLQLSQWDNITYAIRTVPHLLTDWQFPAEKIPAVIDAIASHQPKHHPTTPEAILLHDADLLELLGATGICRALVKTGRDTRYDTYESVLPVLEKALALPNHLILDAAKTLATPRTDLLHYFLTAAHDELCGTPVKQSES